MVQGTASHVGKSLLCLALCRVFRQEGYRVAPFKAVNMSLNAYVTARGEEIAWAQALQAEAAGLEPTADLNPVLLKPRGEAVSQMILRGRPAGDLDARAYQAGLRRRAWAAVRRSLAALQADYDLLVIEGAGSPAEVNLRRTDLANMRVARAAQAPVLLVGDIDRGGVLASLLGTLALLTPSERERVVGLVINKFRGDLGLFEPGVAFLEARARRRVLGVLPWIEVDLEEEDSLALDVPRGGAATAPGPAVEVAVPRYPRLANFVDLDPLRRTPGVRLRLVDSARELGRPDAVVLAGSRNTSEDLVWLRARGLADAIVALARAGTPVVGICGGYQMLGIRLLDPERQESARPEVAGLGLLPVETVFRKGKLTCRSVGRLAALPGPLAALVGERLAGYEIHSGVTRLLGAARPLLVGVARRGAPWLEGAQGEADSTPRPRAAAPACTGEAAAGAGPEDGCVSPDGLVVGTYFHGLFDNARFRVAWVNALRARRGWAPLSLPPPPAPGVEPVTERERREGEFDRLADWARSALDLAYVRRAAGLA